MANTSAFYQACAEQSLRDAEASVLSMFVNNTCIRHGLGRHWPIASPRSRPAAVILRSAQRPVFSLIVTTHPFDVMLVAMG
jgi:hypothetical protein